MKTLNYEYPNLVADTQPPAIPDEVILKKGQGVLKPGTVLGKVTASGVFVVTDKASSDGSEKANRVLTHEVDTDQATDVIAVAYKSGCFFSSALIFDGASVVADHEDELRDLNIYVK